MSTSAMPSTESKHLILAAPVNCKSPTIVRPSGIGFKDSSKAIPNRAKTNGHPISIPRGELLIWLVKIAISSHGQ